MRWLKAAAALAGILALGFGVPALLLIFVGSPWPTQTVWGGPLSDQALIKLVSIAVWILWAQTLWAIIAEAIAVAQSRNTLSAPGTFGVQRQLAQVAIGAVIAAVVTIPNAPAMAHATILEPADDAPATATRSAAEPDASANQDVAASATEDAESSDVETTTITVQRGDSLWSIAADHLGDGESWNDIGRANEGRTMVDGRVFHASEVILPGWELIVPVNDNPSTPSSGDGQADYTVKAGDTLSEIALDTVGDATAWPQIFKASKQLDQPVPMSDPDLIYPGQLIDIPEKTTHEAGVAEVAPAPLPPPDSPSPEPTRTAPPPPTQESSSGSPAIPDSPIDKTDSQVLDTTEDEIADSQLPGWVMPGLTGAGTMLAAGLLLALRRRRASQHRARRPGRVINIPEPTVAEVEKSVVVAGSSTTNTVDLVDDILRRLAGTIAVTGDPMPKLSSVEVTATAVALHLRAPATPPSAWQASDDNTVWTIARNAAPATLGPEPGDRPAPWPMLVTIGHNDHDGVWLLNLEDLTIAVSGDQPVTDNFVRFLAAEVACNPWSRHTRLDAVGIADEVVPMNPNRIHTHEGTAEAAADSVAEAVQTVDRLADLDTDTVTARARDNDPDPWPARLLLVNRDADRGPELDELTKLIDAHPNRTGSAVLFCGGPGAGAFEIQIDEARQLTIPSISLTVSAVGLTVDEAQGCAALLTQASIIDDSPVADFSDDEGWHAMSTTSGSLRDHFRVNRSVDTIEPSASLLNESDAAYTNSAATTVEDLEALAPKVTESIRTKVEDFDPDLDADLHDWFSDNCARPRLTLLGPVGARTSGLALGRRKPYYTELFAYLAMRPCGATTDEVADAFDITPSRVRIDVNKLREWLGTNPHTQERFLPDARNAPAAQSRGVGVYQIIDPLVDVDLFRRLRLRGESRGACGIDDLVHALKLVHCRPFEKLRPGGWGWLLEGDRLDLHMTCAIADIAHVIVTHSLQAGKLDQARSAARIVMTAAPDEEIPRLDLVAVLRAQGHEREAARILHDGVFNRSDDGEPPVDLITRTSELLRNGRVPTRKVI